MDERSILTLCLILARRRRRRRQREPRKWWIHPILADRSTHGKFVVLHNNLKEHPDKFIQHYKMSPKAFQMLLERIKTAISGTRTVMRESVCPEEKLAVTLRYLSTGNSFRLLHLEFLLGRSTIANIIRDTCSAIWNEYKEEFMKLPTEEDWWNISEGFKDKADFPHCIGAVGGKHIRIVKPWSTASDFFQSKKSYSIVLIAVVDVDMRFRYIDVGGHRTDKDSNLLRTTSLGVLERPAIFEGIEEVTYKVLFIGKTGVGKSYTIAHLAGLNHPQSDTLGIEITDVYWPVKIWDKIILFKLQCWEAGDTSMKKYSHIFESCRDGVDLRVFVFSYDGASSFSDLPSLIGTHSVNDSNHVASVVLGTRSCSKTSISSSDVRSFQMSSGIDVFSIPSKFVGASMDDMEDTIFFLNCVCEILWLRDQHYIANNGITV